MKLKISSLLYCVGLLAAFSAPATAEKSSIRMKLVNASPHALREAYVARRGAGTWGRNLLDQALAPGGEALVQIRSGCGTYSLRFVVDEKTEYLEDDLEFCADDDVVTVGSGAVERAHASQ